MAAVKGVKTAVGLSADLPPPQKLKTMIHDGTLGAAIQMRGTANLKDAWRLTTGELAGGGLTSLGIHIGCIYMFGPISEVRGYSAS